MGSRLRELGPPETCQHQPATRGGRPGFRGWNENLKQFVMIKTRLAFFIY